MQFKQYTIAPKGRNKYGNYTSAGNVTRQVQSVTYGGNTTTTDTNTGSTTTVTTKDEISSWLLFLSKTSNVFDGQSVSVLPETDTISLIGYKGQTKAQTYVGDISISATSPTYSITGISESGMSVTVSGNGTSATTISITISSAITESSGKLSIPCNVYLKDLVLGDDISAWNSFQSDCMTVNLDYSWSITTNASSTYVLNLTNDSAGINCDKDGNILSGAVRPTCTAQLYYGVDLVTGVTYGLTVPFSQHVQGVTINTSTGVMTFGSNFTFQGTSVELNVTAKINGTMMASKKMTVSKNYAGQDGKSAVTRWLTLSSDKVKVNTNSACTPTAITATIYEQVGEGVPYETAGTIYWGYETSSPVNVYSAPVVVNPQYASLTFGLKNTDNEFFELESVPILWDGAKGEKGDKGDTGRQGAAMRGPVNWWLQEETRRFCNGVLTDPDFPEDAQFIDIVLKDKVTYICKTSFTGSANDPWSAVSGNFEVVSGKCDFVATNILLADNASIDFTTTNALYLRNSGGTITAGAEGGDGINYWAGSDSPSGAPFTVNNDGTMKATKGEFGCLTIGTDDYDVDNLQGKILEYDNVTKRVTLQPDLIRMEAYNGSAITPDYEDMVEEITLIPYEDPDKYDHEGSVNVEFFPQDAETESYKPYTEKTGFWTNGLMSANGFHKWDTIFGTENGARLDYYAPLVAGFNNIKIVFSVDNTSFFTKNTTDGYWYFHGLKLQYKHNDAYNLQYVRIISDVSSEYCGHYALFRTSSGNDYTFILPIVSSSAVKKDNVIYLSL